MDLHFAKQSVSYFCLSIGHENIFDFKIISKYLNICSHIRGDMSANYKNYEHKIKFKNKLKKKQNTHQYSQRLRSP